MVHISYVIATLSQLYSYLITLRLRKIIHTSTSFPAFLIRTQYLAYRKAIFVYCSTKAFDTRLDAIAKSRQRLSSSKKWT